MISIITILIGIAVPALRSARKRSQKLDELNSIRQVGLAWTMYSNINNDAVLPGYLESQVQQAWDVSYRYSDSSGQMPIPPAPDFELGDNNTAGPWTWRLMKRLNYRHDVVRGHLDDPMLDDRDLPMQGEQIAHQPAFGYNGYYFGGSWYMRQTILGERAYPRMAEARDPGNNRRVGVLQRTISTVQRRPPKCSRIVSTTQVKPGGYMRDKLPDHTPGWHMALPPYLAQEHLWDSNPVAIRALRETTIPIGRYTGKAAVLFADLNTNAIDPTALNDQRMWIGQATSMDWTHKEIKPGE